MAGAFPLGEISAARLIPRWPWEFSVFGISSWPNLWTYLLANFPAAVVAAIAFTMINPPARTTLVATNEQIYETPKDGSALKDYAKRLIGAASLRGPSKREGN